MRRNTDKTIAEMRNNGLEALDLYRQINLATKLTASPSDIEHTFID